MIINKTLSLNNIHTTRISFLNSNEKIQTKINIQMVLKKIIKSNVDLVDDSINKIEILDIKKKHLKN